MTRESELLRVLCLSLGVSNHWTRIRTGMVGWTREWTMEF